MKCRLDKITKFVAILYRSEIDSTLESPTLLRIGRSLLLRRRKNCAGTVIPVTLAVVTTAFLEPLDIIWLDAASTVFVGVFLATAQSFTNLVCCRNTHMPLVKSSLTSVCEAVEHRRVVLCEYQWNQQQSRCKKRAEHCRKYFCNEVLVNVTNRYHLYIFDAACSH